MVLSVALDPADPLYEAKVAFLRRQGRDPSISFPLRVDRIPDELLQFTRFACLAADEGTFSEVDYTRRISARNEDLARSAVIEACEAALAKYPRSLAEDRKLVADRSARDLLGSRQYSALRLCMNEKAILERAISFIRGLP